MPNTYQLITSPSLKKRNAREKRFQWYGRISIGFSLAFLVFLFVVIFSRGVTALNQSRIALDIQFSENLIDPSGSRDEDSLASANYKPLIVNALARQFPTVTSRQDKRRLYKLVSSGAVYELASKIQKNPELIGTTQQIWLLSSSNADLYMKGRIDSSSSEELRKLKNREIAWLDGLAAEKRFAKKFNTQFFKGGDSREPELADILGAAIGSFFTLLVCFAISFPLGIFTAVYLEEFAQKSKITDFIEININNLAAVPSIVFGLLGLQVFLNIFHLPRSTPLVGGMVLALMTLPTIIIASRASLRSVPNTIRDAALGMGASKVQTTFHHAVPLAMPGMLTGTILGMARALGETAPLLMIGMVAFIVDIPKGIADVATTLPVQIFLWADSPEKGFEERTAAASIMLLVFLVLMNVVAVYLRRRMERRW